jgi:hypothetical protein
MTFTVSAELILSLAIVLIGLGVGWGLFRGAMASVVERVDKLEVRHDTHVEKVDKLCTDVSALVARIDMIFTMGRQDAVLRKGGA